MNKLEQSIMEEEERFPSLFANYVVKDYGVLYYMEFNKDSYDGNHAVIYPDRITDLSEVLKDITVFYQAKGITPKIYPPMVWNYLKDHEEVFNKCGYRVEIEEPHRVMQVIAENEIPTTNRLRIEVFHEWQECVATDILLPSGEPWEIEVTKRQVSKPGAYLFIGFLDERAVIYSNIHVSELGNTRYDYIVTNKADRGNGYASEMISYLVEYCKKNHLPNSWQWAGPSEHICYRAGFRETFTIPGGYATYE